MHEKVPLTNILIQTFTTSKHAHRQLFWESENKAVGERQYNIFVDL